MHGKDTENDVQYYKINNLGRFLIKFSHDLFFLDAFKLASVVQRNSTRVKFLNFLEELQDSAHLEKISHD